MNMKRFLSTLAAIKIAAMLAACGGAYDDNTINSDDPSEAPDGQTFSSVQDDLHGLICVDNWYIGDRLMASLAVATGRELKRWDASDFERYTRHGKTYLRISGQGLRRCENGCLNTNAILELQSLASAGIEAHYPDIFRAVLVSNHEKQQAWDQDNPITPHKFTSIHTNDEGGCGIHYWFRVKKNNGRNYGSEALLRDKLQIFGYPHNLWLDPIWNRWSIAVDPSGSMTTGGTASSGSCTVGSPMFDATHSSQDKCCITGGKAGKLKVTSFSPYVYVCDTY